MSDERIEPTPPHQQYPHPVEIRNNEKSDETRERCESDVSAAGVVEVLRKSLAFGEQAEGVEEPLIPQNYVEGDLR